MNQQDVLKAVIGAVSQSGRRRGRGGKSLIGIILLALLGIVLALVAPKENRTTTPGGGPEPGIVAVERCVDGDTIVLKDKTKVRFIGANTPETKKPDWPVEPFGPEAAAFTKQTIENAGNQVRLEFDGDRTDRYGRTLALVYVGDMLLNEELIRQGLAVAELQYHYSREMKGRFQAAEYEAQKARRGIWSKERN